MPPTDPGSCRNREGSDPARLARNAPALQAVDAVTAESLHPNHSQRISRALEVYRQTGVPAGVALPGQKRAAVCVALAPAERRILHERIGFGSIICSPSDSLTKSALYQRGDLHVDLPAVGVGYQQLWSHLSQECSLENAGIKALRQRQLAKRQITWLRWSGLHWLDSGAKMYRSRSKPFWNYLLRHSCRSRLRAPKFGDIGPPRFLRPLTF